MVNPVLVALDTPDLARARRLAQDLAGVVGGFKVGLEMIMANGPSVIAEIASLGSPVFADVKLHDIPNTVEKAASQLGRHGARWLTVHGSGGGEMISAAVTGLERGGAETTGVLVVTVLTSLDQADLAEIGFGRPLEEQVAEMAGLAEGRGAEGVICSPQEATIVKGVTPDLLAVTPGVRLTEGDTHDQKRVTTPIRAMEAGADLLVVGRAITANPDPVQAAKRVVDSLRPTGRL